MKPANDLAEGPSKAGGSIAAPPFRIDARLLAAPISHTETKRETRVV